MNMELYEIYRDIARISDELAEQKIEFSYDPLMGVMGNCHPAEALEMILPKIDWDTPSPDMDMVSEALKQLVELNKSFNIKELKTPIKNLKKFISLNK